MTRHGGWGGGVAAMQEDKNHPREEWESARDASSFVASTTPPLRPPLSCLNAARDAYTATQHTHTHVSKHAPYAFPSPPPVFTRRRPTRPPPAPPTRAALFTPAALASASTTSRSACSWP